MELPSPQSLASRWAERLAPWQLAAIGALLLWLAQPPAKLWPLAWVALIPWILIAVRTTCDRRSIATFYLVAVVYWAVTMQGIRHAHPAMYFTLALFSLYLAVYPVLFLVLLRHLVTQGRRDWILSVWIAAPILWTGLECIRNYLLTGVSAVMLGHTLADVPPLIQIADAFGSYGVTFLVVWVNASIAHCLLRLPRWPLVAATASAAVVLTLAYGYYRLDQRSHTMAGEPLTIRIALIGRDEPVIFEQDSERQWAIFDRYAMQSLATAQVEQGRGGRIDLVVWPESMFSGSLPWLEIDDEPGFQVPEGVELSQAEFRELIDDSREQFERRAADLQAALRQATGQGTDPELLVGCGVVRYGQVPQVHSAVVHIAAGGRVVDWYAKTHLVMFGEYIPLIDYLPWLHRLIPPGMGVTPGDRAVAMTTVGVTHSPNICIETAVERVTANHVRDLTLRGETPDVLINVTNDGWFDRSSIVDHHLRCCQFVAIATRRPLLVAANGGPTVAIDGSGAIMQRVAYDQNESLVVSPFRDGRPGWHQTIGDWPARAMAILTFAAALAAAVESLVRHRRQHSHVTQ